MRSMGHLPIVNRISEHFRANRFEVFLQMLHVGPEDRILDVGGSPYFWLGSGIEPRVTILNIGLPQIRPEPFSWVQGDACAMSMIADQEFDVVFSNSVIEHVGDLPEQQRMAEEVRRVAKRYWVQTPYKHFPIEPHFIFPFFQYLPARLRYSVARVWPFSFAKRGGSDPVKSASTIWLLDMNQFQTLFPDAQFQREKVLGLTKSLLAYRT